MLISYIAPAKLLQNIQINTNIKNTKAIKERKNRVIMNKVNNVESCFIMEPPYSVLKEKESNISSCLTFIQRSFVK